MTFTVSAGINSTVEINSQSFAATTSLERSREVERVDVTGFGSTSRAFVAGLLGPLEYTVKTYSDPGNLSVGSSYTYQITFAGGSQESGTALVTAFSSSADLEGATVHEITLLDI